MPKAAPPAPKARLLPATAEEKAAHQAFDVAMRQLVIDLDQVDKNGDRKLDFYEFSALVREREIGIQNRELVEIELSIYAMRDSLSRNKARLADLLAQWDADKNGTVERDEFRAVLRDQWGANLHTKDVDALFDDLDEDGSGALDLVDLTRKLERGPRLMPKGVKQAELRSLDWRQESGGPKAPGGSDVLDASKAMGTTKQRVKTMFKQLDKFLKKGG